MLRPRILIHAEELRDGIPYKRCPKCGDMKELDDFGLRRKVAAAKTGQDIISVQSRCHDCRVEKEEVA